MQLKYKVKHAERNRNKKNERNNSNNSRNDFISHSRFNNSNNSQQNANYLHKTSNIPVNAFRKTKQNKKKLRAHFIYDRNLKKLKLAVWLCGVFVYVFISVNCVNEMKLHASL